MIARKGTLLNIVYKKRIRVLGPQKTDEPTKFLTDKSSFSLLLSYL